MVGGDQHQPILAQEVRTRLKCVHHEPDLDVHGFDGVQIRKYEWRKSVGVTGVVGVVQVDENRMRVSRLQRIDDSRSRLGSRGRVDHHIG